MRRLLAVLAALGAALAFTASASALDVGVTEDEGILSPAFVYGTLQDLGMKTNVMSIRWDPLNPTGLPANFPHIKASVDAANARGIQVILATYQDKARGITDTPAGSAVFAAWLQQVARACPQCVRKIVILNEPNQPRFFQPIFDTGCQPAAPAAYAQVLAAAYDALKEIDSSIRVYGIGLSPRGNDRCTAASNISLSPTTFLLELGKAYKAMGRTKPLMDALSFHPYPNVNTDEPMKGYVFPNIGVPNLDRLKQVFEDAFGGTAQPTFKDGLKVALDEVGWQVDTSSHGGYVGNENVPIIDEATQARYYAELVAFFACDPSVESLNFFHLVDEGDRDRFQSGLMRVDRSPRASYDSVKKAIAANAAACQGKPASWKPAATVAGAKAFFGKLGKSSSKRTYWSFSVYADEDATFEAAIYRVGSKKPVMTASGAINAKFRPLVRFAKKRLKPGSYYYVVVIAAKSDPDRKNSFKSTAFNVG